MATRNQGLLLGCLLFLAAAAFLTIMTVSTLGRLWSGDSLTSSREDKVGLVVLEGPIGESRFLVEEIEANRRDDTVKSVVFRINSPGGEVAPSQEIFEAILRLGESKPVVASLGSVAASGALYAAVAADSIIANPGSIVGSIGVIMMYPTAPELLEKLGVEMQVYKSGRLKDMGNFARLPTEEEEEVFDSIIADVFDQFVTAVASRRHLDREYAVSLADGRVYSGRQARDIGLVDQLGDMQAAIELAGRLGGLDPDPPVVRKNRPRFPLLEIWDQLIRDNARAVWGPHLEYRLR
jgi:protease-4